ncbi:Piso0_004705 [Millerozyma farinosa CBS 7064]|uniref:Piso0_004705 protein n=1 Tax=Pichia sorbitophila (strain ATCC MYA-4447 / BCRC 22081 / CBS 7064 / NBRC 10061 / NRRL Y-12695) TaxID=559304 RepID=G8Y9I8_PICSO|nr:Piso0_004705 [Millerozyma farinosa CBS 7064]CCE85133.1 Piso0_004705 [Millerozyma farinosa CBS 7064]
MSLFRTLQHSPAVITMFHNQKVPASASLHDILSKAYYKLNDKDQLFQLDVCSNQMPTYDQYVLITSQCLKDKQSQSIIDACFPFMYERQLSEAKKRVTIRSPSGITPSPSGGHKVFSEGEYSLISETFASLLEENHPNVDPANIFKAPLVIDWDQCLIANDESTLSTLLKAYK